MAERSFKQEVEKLKLGEGAEFHGEGILAVTKALLQSGVSYVAGYQGAPISHLMDVMADASDILDELGVHFENSASEATAAATLAASVNYPLRGAVTFKSTVGTNVASDALANLASGGVTGGALIIIGEDYGEGSSIMQERVHAFAMKSQMWLLDPRPNLPSIVRAVETGFELSEASNTPVMLELRIRACHVYGHFTARGNKRPDFTLADALENPRRDLGRIAMPPMTYVHEKDKWEQRWPAAVKFIEQRGLNEFFDSEASDIGIVVQGGLYNTTIRGRAEVHRAPSARLAGACPAGGRRGAAQAAAVERARCRGGQGARPAALVLHRLSGAADLRRDEARRARSRPASRQRRHRLPPVLDLSAVQHRRHHNGLRPRRGRRLRAQHQGRQARHRHDGRRRILA
jgi:TPP-dependent indolepyruvate ferredoxin oxidoreductase alpha subunit